MNGYRTAQAARLSGLSYRQLDYYVREGVVAPSLRSTTPHGTPLWGDTAGGSGTARRWSAHDVGVLHVLAMLRASGVGLDRLRKVVDELRGRPIDHGWLVVNEHGVKRVDDLRWLGSIVSNMAPAAVVELRPIEALAS